MKTLIIRTIFLSMLSTSVYADENSEARMNEIITSQSKARALTIINNAWDAYKIGDYKTAFDLWYPLAEKGNPSAQMYIGLMYSQGHSVDQDDAAAANWYTLASDQGYAPAEWRLAVLYHHGSGLAQNHQKSAELYNSAARKGDLYAQKALGVIFSQGLGIQKDNILAHLWLNISGENGLKLGEKYRYELAQSMSPEEISLSNAMAKECLESRYDKCGYSDD